VLEVVLNCCRVCYDPEIEVKVMSTETTSGNTGFRFFFSQTYSAYLCLTLMRFTAYLTDRKTKKTTNSRTAKRNPHPTVILYTMNFVKTNSIGNKIKERNYCTVAQAVHRSSFSIGFMSVSKILLQIRYHS